MSFALFTILVVVLAGVVLLAIFWVVRRWL
jgi:hypothetical protein